MRLAVLVALTVAAVLTLAWWANGVDELQRGFAATLAVGAPFVVAEMLRRSMVRVSPVLATAALAAGPVVRLFGAAIIGGTFAYFFAACREKSFLYWLLATFLPVLTIETVLLGRAQPFAKTTLPDTAKPCESEN